MTENGRMSNLQYFFYSIGRSFAKLGKKIATFFVNIGLSVFYFFRNFPRNAKRCVLAVGRFFGNLAEAFVRGSVFVKLSFIFMGAGAIGAKQYVKGVVLFLLEAAFITFMALLGADCLVGLGTLGTQTTMTLPSGGVKMGDNSMLFLLYGIATVLILIGFVALYFGSILSGYTCCKTLRAGGKVNGFRDDMRALLDEKFYVTLLILPIVGVLAFTVLPLIYMIMISFTNFDAEHQPPSKLFDWIGFRNFVNIFAKSELSTTFGSVFIWTIIWAFFATFSNYIGGIIVALMINKKGIRGKALFRTIFVLTIAIPQFVSLLVMRNFLGDWGPVNGLLMKWGWIKEPIGFFTSSKNQALLPKVMIILVNLWVGIPFTMLITTGILLNIPEDLYEAARIDGANTIRLFASITIPYILFITAPYLITQFIGNINNFNLIYLLTGGGPTTLDFYKAGRTDLLVTWLFKLTTDVNKDYNLASVIGIFTFLISAAISLLTYTQTNSYKNEGDFA